MLNRIRGEHAPKSPEEVLRSRGDIDPGLEALASIPAGSLEPQGLPHRLWKVLETALDEDLRTTNHRATLETWATEMLSRVGRHVRNRMPRHSSALGEVEDIVQEIALRILNSLERFEGRGEGSIWPWVHTIAERGLQDAWRRHATRRSECVEPWDKVLEGVADVGTPLSRLLDAESHQRFHRALKQLDERLATAILLRLESELYYRDIARSLNYASADAARMAVHRGLVEVKAILADPDLPAT